jgi:hypothetical protein
MCRRSQVWFTLSLLLTFAGCHVSIDSADDAGPVKSESRSVERGKAESVRATIHMGAGELTIQGGAAKLLDADFRATHMPEIVYDANGARGTLEIRGPKKSGWSNQRENTWKLKFDDKTPLDLVVHLGAGETDLDLSTLELRSLEVHMGVGELKLNLDGDYQRDVAVDVQGGVGRAEIRLPRKIGAQVDAKGGMGSLKARGLKQENGQYVNAAFEKSKRQVRCKVRGGIGEIELIGDSE